MISKYFIVILSIIGLVNAQCESVTCQAQPKHYEELQCKPVIEEGECCPVRYDCLELSGKIDSEKCVVNGKLYERREKIPESEINDKCQPLCMCDAYSEPPRVHCAHNDCPEFFQPYKPDCIRQKSLDACCTDNLICDKEAIEKLAICEFDSKTYRDGEVMYPKDYPCYKCQCNSSFDNTTIIDNPNCKRVNCGIGLRTDKVRAGCIPVYFGLSTCCPINWKCPDENDKLVASEVRSAIENPAATCEFGKVKMQIGDGVTSGNQCMECKCLTPPIAQCIQKPDC